MRGCSKDQAIGTRTLLRLVLRTQPRSPTSRGSEAHLPGGEFPIFGGARARNAFRSGVGCRELRKRRNNNRRYSREKTFRESVIGDYRRYARFCSKMRFERLMQGCYTEAMTTAELMKAD